MPHELDWHGLLDKIVELLDEADEQLDHGMLDATIHYLHGVRSMVNAAEDLVQAKRRVPVGVEG